MSELTLQTRRGWPCENLGDTHSDKREQGKCTGPKWKRPSYAQRIKRSVTELRAKILNSNCSNFYDREVWDPMGTSTEEPHLNNVL